MGKVIGPCHVSCVHRFPPGFSRKVLNCIFITHALLHLVIRVNVSNNITVVGVRFPLSFSALVVAATPRMPPSFPGSVFFYSLHRILMCRLGKATPEKHLFF